MLHEVIQASISVVITEDNLEQAETKGYPLQNKKNKTMSTYLKGTAMQIEKALIYNRLRVSKAS